MKKKNYVVSKNAETNIIYMKVLGFMNFEEMQEMWGNTMPLMSNEQQKILYDATLGKALPAKSRQWAVDVLGKQLSEKKVKIARVVSKDIFNNLIAEKIKEKISKHAPTIKENVQVFENVAQAEEWLMSS
ncbi:hypothetical protein [uncultured Microscilla sp.]|uniref:hypothetical protein n=1 Tax=uncultured Microscilla sp. TaxID=432653 RepID=UPI00262236E2|nr:hypothetical protein [uncultured Microscilla sp.]